MQWGWECHVEFNAGKTNSIVLFDWSNDSGVIYSKMNRYFLKENSSFRILGLFFPSKCNWKF